MRSLAAVMGVASLFALALLGAHRIAGGSAARGDSAGDYAVTPFLPLPSANTADPSSPPSSPGDGGSGGCSEAAEHNGDKRASVVLARFNPRDPRERRNGRDEKLARRAVLDRSSFAECWKPLPRSPEEGAVRCRGHDPDLSAITLTGRAGSLFADQAAAVVSSVSVFATAQQAIDYFHLTATRSAFRCVQGDLKAYLARNDASPRLDYARLRTEPPVGDQTAMFLLRFSIAMGERTGYYPLEIITFRSGRAVAVVSVSAVGSVDGALRKAMLVASRLA